MLTVVELKAYIDEVEALFSEDERSAIISYLSERPKAGVLITGTGGVRKLRWGRGGKGKSSGVRIVYFFYSDVMPLYLITAFAKADKENLSKEGRNDLAGLTRHLTSIWLGKKK
jgi:hypothetical protein